MKTIKHIAFFVFLTFLGTLLYTSCSKANFGDDVILVTGTEVNPVIKFKVADNTESTYAVTATATNIASKDIKVNFEFDPDAIESYNKIHNTKFSLIPKQSIKLENLSTIIKAGSSASTPVNVKLLSTTSLVDGKTYLIPLTIKNTSSSMKILESSKTIFLKIARTIYFPALDMASSGGSFNATYYFPKEDNVSIPSFTYEIKLLCYGFRDGDGSSYPQPIQYITTWGSDDSSFLMRFGELGNPNNSLQIVGPSGNAFTYGFNANQWYTISVTYDSSKALIYVDGVKSAEISGSASIKFGMLSFGQNWGGYDTRQYFNGRIAECRMWTRALPPSEIAQNLCGGADPKSPGLLGYWKLDEDTGHVFHNSSSAGSKYDADWSKVHWNPSGSKLIPADKSQYIKWTNDALNKCSQ